MEQHRTVLAAKLPLGHGCTVSRRIRHMVQTYEGTSIIYSRFYLTSNGLRLCVDDAEQTGWGLGIASFSPIPIHIVEILSKPSSYAGLHMSAVCAGVDVRWLSRNNANGCLISLFKAGQRESNGTFKQPRATART